MKKEKVQPKSYCYRVDLFEFIDYLSVTESVFILKELTEPQFRSTNTKIPGVSVIILILEWWVNFPARLSLLFISYTEVC